MTTTLLSSHACLLRSVATRGCAPRSLVQHRRQRQGSGSGAPSPKASSPCGRRVGVGLLASLTYSALCAVPAAAATLCDDTHGDGDGNGDGDGDVLSKLKAALRSRSLPDLPHGDAFDFDRLATALGGQAARALASGIPADLSYGFCAGFFSGLALKKVGRAASVVLGVGFLTLQTLAYHGYIEVHHDKLQREVEGLLDRNGDGVVDGEDLKSLLTEVKKVAGFGLDDEQKLIASGGGFGMGFLGGLRSG